MITKMKTVKQLISLKGLVIFAVALVFVSCDNDDNTLAAPEAENDVEVITDVTLIFTNAADATDVVTATATDTDGSGIEELKVSDAVNLKANTTYNLSLEIQNSLAEGEEANIAAEILEEADEHQLFYGFTAGAFSNPMGDGNIDETEAGAVNYTDFDDNNLPIGLTTTWTTASASTGNFRVVLQHQPAENGVAVKTATSDAADGDRDFDLNFVLNIE